MKRLLFLLMPLSMLIGMIHTPSAGAIDGFITPFYSPNTSPAILQTEPICPNAQYTVPNCEGWHPLDAVRWVRQGGQDMQGPFTQSVHEMALTAVVCSYGDITENPQDNHIWIHWTSAHNESNPSWPFCTFDNWYLRSDGSDTVNYWIYA